MKKLLLFLSLAVMVSCSEKAVEKPENLIDKDVMIDILYDITVMQSAETVDPIKMNQNNVKVNELIYKKYNIDSITFNKSNRYYASDPNRYKKMYGEVYHRLEKATEALGETSMGQTGKPIEPSDTPAIQ
ncbi:DUF4296 domain-containing protein [Flavobacterium sp. SM15]|uniref:DUF4296 domain-containing protein n=1 Tax=Flavobacterium sp. SM15 TaxID=2908005 RepID=UPI001EDAEABA|nr:DUF4296 domain-containing protein [Flavobacterium sp. SM15]MCG2610098.1 DUF4296 domain-containing protein [Flavobacterium sp. SM15]